MATGDKNDILFRLGKWMPTRWFPAETGTRLSSVLTGFASLYAGIYNQIAYAKLQTRIATATDGWLDLISQDFFSYKLRRQKNEQDPQFSVRIRSNLFLEKGTRSGLVNALTLLTGQIPGVFEPARPADTGSYNRGGMGYNTAGGYGSLLLPFEFLVTAYIPHASGGIAGVQGYASLGQSYAAVGGYGVGAIEYAQLGMVASGIGVSDVTRMVQDVKPAATIGWLATVYGISPYGPHVEPLGSLILGENELGPDASPAPLGQFLLGSNVLGDPGTITSVPAGSYVITPAAARALRLLLDEALSLMGHGVAGFIAGEDTSTETNEQKMSGGVAQAIGLLAEIDQILSLGSVDPTGTTPTPAPTGTPTTSVEKAAQADLAAALASLYEIFSVLSAAAGDATPANEATLQLSASDALALLNTIDAILAAGSVAPTVSPTVGMLADLSNASGVLAEMDGILAAASGDFSAPSMDFAAGVGTLRTAEADARATASSAAQGLGRSGQPGAAAGAAEHGTVGGHATIGTPSASAGAVESETVSGRGDVGRDGARAGAVASDPEAGSSRVGAPGATALATGPGDAFGLGAAGQIAGGGIAEGRDPADQSSILSQVAAAGAAGEQAGSAGSGATGPVGGAAIGSDAIDPASASASAGSAGAASSASELDTATASAQVGAAAATASASPKDPATGTAQSGATAAIGSGATNQASASASAGSAGAASSASELDTATASAQVGAAAATASASPKDPATGTAQSGATAATASASPKDPATGTAQSGATAAIGSDSATDPASASASAGSAGATSSASELDTATAIARTGTTAATASASPKDPASGVGQSGAMAASGSDSGAAPANAYTALKLSGSMGGSTQACAANPSSIALSAIGSTLTLDVFLGAGDRINTGANWGMLVGQWDDNGYPALSNWALCLGNGSPATLVFMWVGGDGNFNGVACPTSIPTTDIWVRSAVSWTGKTVSYFSSTDGSSWTALGATQSFPSGAVIPSSPPSAVAVSIGNDSNPGIHEISGYFYAAKVVRNGTTLFSVDFRTATPGASTVADAVNGTWTLQGTFASIIAGH